MRPRKLYFCCPYVLTPFKATMCFLGRHFLPKKKNTFLKKTCGNPHNGQGTLSVLKFWAELGLHKRTSTPTCMLCMCLLFDIASMLHVRPFEQIEKTTA